MATPTITFRPNHPKNKDGSFKTSPCPILVEVYTKTFRTELSTGLKVYPANFTDGRATNKEKDYRAINTELARIETDIVGVCLTSHGSAGSDLKSLIRAAVRGEVKVIDEKKTVIPWIENFIKEAKVKPKTKQVYNSSLDHLKNYAAGAGLTLTWESFDLNFYGAFTQFLYDIPHCDNTVGKVIKTLKTFLSEAFERDLHQNLNFKKKSFRVISAPVDTIYLDEKEIDQFESAEVPADLIPSQKLFVFACEVGLRYSDLVQLNPNNLVTTLAGHRLDVTTKKTGEDVKISLSDRAKMLWDGWQGLPPRIPNPTFNENIKLVAEKARITKPCQRRDTIKGDVKIEWLPKFKMVTAHTARRSFATNSFLKGIPNETIMAVTGHRTEKAFKKYIKVDKEQHAAIMQKHFNKGTEEQKQKAG